MFVHFSPDGFLHCVYKYITSTTTTNINVKNNIFWARGTKPLTCSKLYSLKQPHNEGAGFTSHFVMRKIRFIDVSRVAPGYKGGIKQT